MPEDPLVRLHAHGYHVQRQIAMEYRAACDDPAWAAQCGTLLARWRGIALEWAGQVETALAGDGTNLTAVSRFHNAPQPSSAPVGVDLEWAGIHDYVVVRLDVLGQIIEARRPSAAAPLSVGVLNLGTILGDVHGSVTHLQQSGHAELAQLLRQVIEKLPTSDLSDIDKGDAAHFTRVLAEEAARPGKLSSAGWTMARALGQILTRSAEFAQVWQGIDTLLKWAAQTGGSVTV